MQLPTPQQEAASPAAAPKALLLLQSPPRTLPCTPPTPHSHLQALVEHTALALDTHILGPLDEAVHVPLRGQVAADACSSKNAAEAAKAGRRRQAWVGTQVGGRAASCDRTAAPALMQQLPFHTMPASLHCMLHPVLRPCGCCWQERRLAAATH